MRQLQPAFVPRYPINEGRGMSNRFIISDICDQASAIYVACRPLTGHQVDIAHQE